MVWNTNQEFCLFSPYILPWIVGIVIEDLYRDYRVLFHRFLDLILLNLIPIKYQRIFEQNCFDFTFECKSRLRLETRPEAVCFSRFTLSNSVFNACTSLVNVELNGSKLRSYLNKRNKLRI